MSKLEVPTQPVDDHSSESIAAAFRAQAYDLMDRSPIAAAHLVLAAATLAPECEDERDVAEQFSFVMADFAVELARIRHRVRDERVAVDDLNGVAAEDGHSTRISWEG